MAIRIGGNTINIRRIGQIVKQFYRLGTNIIWQRPTSINGSVSPESITFNGDGTPEDIEVTLSYDRAFVFESVEQNIVIPEGVTVTEDRRFSVGSEQFVILLVNAEATDTTDTTTQNIQITLTNDNMALNVTVNRRGQVDIRELRIIDNTGNGSGPSPSAGGDVLFYYEGRDGGYTGTQQAPDPTHNVGARYVLTEGISGSNDDTAAFSTTPVNGTTWVGANTHQGSFTVGTSPGSGNPAGSSLTFSNIIVSFINDGSSPTLATYRTFLTSLGIDASGITATNRNVRTIPNGAVIQIGPLWSGEQNIQLPSTAYSNSGTAADVITTSADYRTITFRYNTDVFSSITRANGAMLLPITQPTIHTGTWTASTENRTRNIRLTANSIDALSDTLTSTFTQLEDAEVSGVLSVVNNNVTAGETITLTASHIGGDDPSDYRIFSGDTTATFSVVPSAAFSSTSNRIFTTENSSAATVTTTVTAVEGTNTYTLYVRDSDGDISAPTVLTFYGTRAQVFQSGVNPDRVPWFYDSQLIEFTANGIPNTATLSANVAGTNATASTPSYNSTTSRWNVTVTWSTANGNRSSGRSAVVSIIYQGLSVFGTLSVSQNALNSTVSQVTSQDASGNSYFRNWNDITSREIVIAISSFPAPITAANAPITTLETNPSTFNFSATGATSSGSGNNRNVSVGRTGVSDEQLTSVGIVEGQTVVLRNSSTGIRSTATVFTVSSTFLFFTNVSGNAVINHATGLQYSVTAETTRTIPVGGLSNRALVSSVTIGGIPASYSNTGVNSGYRNNYAFTGVNASTTTSASVSLNVAYRGVTIGSTSVSRTPRPAVTQRLMNPDGTSLDLNTTFDTIISEDTGTDFSIWVLHDIAHSFISVTDGTGSDFVSLTPENTPAAVALPNTFADSVAAGSENIDSGLYARRTRIDLTTSNANGTVSRESDTFCVNIA